MNASRLLTMTMIVSSMMLSLSAQEVPPKKKGNLEFGLGFNTFGPEREMAKLMVEHHFDKNSQNWLFGGTIKHPNYDRVGLSLQISYSHYLGPRSQLGILFQISSLNTAHGHANPGGKLDIGFSNISLVPLYTYDLGESWEIQVGPALMINLAYQDPFENEEIYTEPTMETKLSPGLLSGLNLKIHESRIFYLKIGIQHLLTTYNNIGPFTSEDYAGTTTLPESRVNFSHLKIHFVLGWHN